MIFHTKPEGFDHKITVVASYVLAHGKVLFLQRQPHKTHGGKWGLPAGKVDVGELHQDAVSREVFEETGLQLKPNDFNYLRELWVENEGHQISYHTYSVTLGRIPNVQLNFDEHSGYIWAEPHEAAQLPLVHDLHQCNEIFFGQLGIT